MKPSAVRNLVKRVMTEWMNGNGFTKQAGLNDFFVKMHSQDFNVGLLPEVLEGGNNDYYLRFKSGIQYLPLEEQLDALGGTALCYGDMWTICRQERFSEDFHKKVWHDPSMGRRRTDFLENDRFQTEMTEEAILERLDLNISMLQKYSLPWLNQCAQNPLESVVSNSNCGKTVRRLIAYLMANEIETVETKIETYRTDPLKCPSGPVKAREFFFNNILKVCQEKRASGAISSLTCSPQIEQAGILTSTAVYLPAEDSTQ